MIEFSPSELFALLVVIPFVLVGLGGLVRRVREWREAAGCRHRTIRCRYCGTLLERPPGKATVNHCPACRAGIPAGRDRRLG